MLNQSIIVGRLVENPQTKKENEKEVSYVTLAVPRSYKNENGEYDTDFIDVVLWNGIAQNTAEYCHKGDIVGIKGRLQTNVKDDKKEMILVAEKVTFLSSKKQEEE